MSPQRAAHFQAALDCRSIIKIFLNVYLPFEPTDEIVL